MLDLESAKGELQRKIHMLEEEREETKNWKPFEILTKEIEKPFVDSSGELNQLYRQLQDKEKQRLCEALHDYLEGGYYSSVAMAVSTIEYRLLVLMKKANSNEAAKLEEMTFGGLIKEYLDHEKDKYQNLLPSVHKPLLQLCNTYRIFSVHPKQEEINRKVATSVLNLTLEFLLDEKTVVI